MNGNNKFTSKCPSHLSQNVSYRENVNSFDVAQLTNNLHKRKTSLSELKSCQLVSTDAKCF